MIKSERITEGQPEIEVHFISDEHGKPAFIESNGRKHFKIAISIKNPADDEYAVNYQLHSSYVNPFRQETNKAESFCFNTTTYGDYILSAELMGRRSNSILSTLVSQALENGGDNELQKEALESVRNG